MFLVDLTAMNLRADLKNAPPITLRGGSNYSRFLLLNFVVCYFSFLDCFSGFFLSSITFFFIQKQQKNIIEKNAKNVLVSFPPCHVKNYSTWLVILCNNWEQRLCLYSAPLFFASALFAAVA